MSGTAEQLPPEDVEKFRKDALGIAKKMIEIIKNMKPVFGNEESIENSDDYQKFLEESQNNPALCNEYTSNKLTE